MIVTTAQLFHRSLREVAIGAYNSTTEQTMGLFKGASPARPPFIIQISNRRPQIHRQTHASKPSSAPPRQIFPEAIFAVHLDHGDEETCYDCIDSGFYTRDDRRLHEPFGRTSPSPNASSTAPTPKGISVEASSACWRPRGRRQVDEGHAC